MGSIVAYRCTDCTFSTGELRIGWGKSGRATFWGGLTRCDPCGALAVTDIAVRRDRTRTDPRCEKCGGLVTPIDGTFAAIRCPRCRGALHHQTVGTWS